MSLPEEEMQRQLRTGSHTGSPALAGQGPSVTGVPDPTVVTPSTSSTAPLPPGGNATGASAPLSQTGANESRGGGEVDPNAEALFAQVQQDGGTPMEAMSNRMYERGSDQVMTDVQDSYEAVNVDSGQFSQDRETALAEGERFNKAIGLDNGEVQRGARADIANMFGDMTQREVDNEIISRKEKKKKDEQFTKFLGGMSRQEFGMFLFDWGARMMANADRGAGVAAGMASGGAMQGHLARRQQAEDREVEAAERERQAGLEERGMVAEERRALAGLGEGETINTDSGLGVLRVDEDGNYSVEILKDPETGEPLREDFASSRGYQGEKLWITDNLVAEGVPRDVAMDIATGARNASERAQLLQDQLGNLRNDITARDSRGRRYSEYTDQEAEQWILRQMQLADRAAAQYRQSRELDRALRDY